MMVSDGVGGVGLALGSSLLELCECSVSGLGLVVVGGWARVGMGGAGRGPAWLGPDLLMPGGPWQGPAGGGLGWSLSWVFGTI